jgi:hypothetical protein
MPEPLSPHEREVIWQHDVRLFLRALLKYWFLCLSSTIGSGFFALIQAYKVNLMIPHWVLWLVAIAGILVSAFLAFRDCLRKIESQLADFEFKTSQSNAEAAAMKAKLESERDVALAELVILKDKTAHKPRAINSRTSTGWGYRLGCLGVGLLQPMLPEGFAQMGSRSESVEFGTS